MLKSILKAIFPLSVLRFAKQLLLNVDTFLAVFLSKSTLGTQLYYLIFNKSFLREQVSTLKGRAKYLSDKGVSQQRYIRLRRNIHRIEKGLIMQPRRQVFALDYIAQTVADYQRYKKDNEKSSTNDEFQWFHDVLVSYFQVVDNSHSLIAKAKRGFESVAIDTEGDCSQSSSYHDFSHHYVVSDSQHSHLIPYPKRELVESTLSFEQLQTLVKQRRSVRWFQQKKIPETLLLKAIDAARYAPSACNRQPFQFYVANQAVKAEQMLSLAMGTVGFAQQVPCAIGVVGDLSCYEAERDRHLIYIDASLAAMQLMLALETLGLSSCPINWPDIEQREKQISTLLNLSNTQRPVMLLAIGYADPEGQIPYSQKCSAEQLVTFIK